MSLTSSVLFCIRLLVINTNNVGHALTIKAAALATASGVPVHYTSKHNVNALAKDILLGNI